MSDLFKRHTPKLTEEEERALWERVRTLPGEVAGAAAPARSGRSWWQGLFAMPAVRYGAPVLAVALVAVVWVVQQSPTPPVRERVATKSEAPPAVVTAPTPTLDTDQPAPPADAPATASARPDARESVAGLETDGQAKPDAADALAKQAAPVAELARPTEAPAPFAAAPGKDAAPAAPARKSAVGEALRVTPAEKEAVAQRLEAAPAPAPASGGANWGSGKSAYRTGRDEALPPPGIARERSQGQVLVEPARLADVLALAPGETAFLRVRLPLSGGTAWIAAGRGLEGTLRMARFGGGNAQIVRYAYPDERSIETGMREAVVRPYGPVARVAILVSDLDFQAVFVGADGDEHMLPRTPDTTLRGRRAALGVELLLNRPQRAAILGVRSEIERLAAEGPDNGGMRALSRWGDDLVREGFAPDN